MIEMAELETQVNQYIATGRCTGSFSFGNDFAQKA